MASKRTTIRDKYIVQYWSRRRGLYVATMVTAAASAAFAKAKELQDQGLQVQLLREHIETTSEILRYEGPGEQVFVARQTIPNAYAEYQKEKA